MDKKYIFLIICCIAIWWWGINVGLKVYDLISPEELHETESVIFPSYKSEDNIYNSNGTLSSERTIQMDSVFVLSMDETGRIIEIKISQ